jgi:YesN/AraC family two-component response regulator
MPGKKLSVLLVDDSRTVLLQIEKAILASEDAEVVGTASNGAEAIQKASELKPDLVVMDIVMPGVDGLAALRMLQAKQPDIRVVMLSSVGGMASKAEEAFRLGAVQVLGKPVDDEILAALLTQEFERLAPQPGS